MKHNLLETFAHLKPLVKAKSPDLRIELLRWKKESKIMSKVLTKKMLVYGKVNLILLSTRNLGKHNVLIFRTNDHGKYV